jgi:hypothetical protein
MSAGWGSRQIWARIALLVALAAAIVALASTSASAHRARAASPDIRRWHGTWIESMDPASTGVRAAPSSSASTPASHTDEILSNELTFTRWAFVTQIANIYRGPSTKSRQVSRLHWYTEDGFDEVYLLLRTHWDANGKEWVEIRIPARPNGQIGWVRRSALGAFRLTHTLVVVNRAHERMSFFVNGRKIWSAPVGIGKSSTPTPSGHYWIRERFMVIPPSSGYYPYAFGTADYSTLKDWEGGGVVGIHGPYGQAASIPGQISHGCIRLKVSDDFWLGHHIQLGTPLHVV